MTDLPADLQALAAYRPVHTLRFVTAASLFDGHDAWIDLMRRLLMGMGADVIHLGHNRSVDEVVTAALQEDVHGIAVSSHQGGHVEYFEYMVALLRERGGGDIAVFGGGGVIVADEIRALAERGVRIFSPDDGQRMGPAGMVGEMLMRCDRDLATSAAPDVSALRGHTEAAWRALAKTITTFENGAATEPFRAALHTAAAQHRAPVLGITGTGSAGTSSLTDELIRRFRLDQGDALRIAVLSIDPPRRKRGGALLGDRLRMNAIAPWPKPGGSDDGRRVYMRSLATRSAGGGLSAALPEAIAACRAAGFDLVVVETSGIGQGDASLVAHVDVPLYVMTPEFGAASQLEKIDLLDVAEFVVLNKFDRTGAADALRDVAKQVQRHRGACAQPLEAMPVFGTTASRFNDDGVTALYQALAERLATLGLQRRASRLPRVAVRHSSQRRPIVPAARVRYLGEIAEAVRGHKQRARAQAVLAREAQQLRSAAAMLAVGKPDKPRAAQAAIDLAAAREARLDADARQLLADWPATRQACSGDEQMAVLDAGTPRERHVRTALATGSLSGTPVPKIALPRHADHGDLLEWLMLENLPGRFPYTAGVFEFKRHASDEDDEDGEEPTRLFAGEGDAFRTNRRFKMLSAGSAAQRLSTAFDSVTRHGHDPARRPDLYGKVGNAGVSIATLDDMAALYDGFDLASPATSVSMTIDGPAPTVLAMFLNVAIDQALHGFARTHGREPTPHESLDLRARTLAQVRGSVQASVGDILKEDQGQNTGVFSTEFSLKVMGDIAEWFVEHGVRNFHSASIGGPIAEAGANPISQLAMTLAKGFTCVEACLARGLRIDDFAPHLSLSFSNGMDAEYAVLGRVARRIWAVAMRDRYGAAERSQKLKCHVQTSGRGLHAQEELTDRVEEAVLAELDRLSERGGLLGAMETGEPRGGSQDESIDDETRQHSGALPIVGVVALRAPPAAAAPPTLARSTEAEKQSQLARLADFHTRHAAQAPAMLARLQQAVIDESNVFDVLMDAVRVCSLGQITDALLEVGGQYRRSL